MTDDGATKPNATGTALLVIGSGPHAEVRHDSSYVTMLLAHAAGLPAMPMRRRSDRAAPLAAYDTAKAGFPCAKTRRIV